ncbi:lipase, class 3 [Ophiocordyceps camponoti-floridani]|uniref:Lipase, class 3 n=1 Tax=Ophiocordyceps camponoti-floridani TaxID=2030778 RepID=A0A8H4VDT9_9HYPO|nr:lipase, class 3 [Ophiocordyceps camponoti-floridani]
MGFFSGRKSKSTHVITDPPNVYLPPAPHLPTVPGLYPSVHRPVPPVPSPPPPGWAMISSVPAPAHHRVPRHPASAGYGCATPDDDMIRRFDRVLTLIDHEQYDGQDAGLFLYQASPDLPPPQQTTRAAPHDITQRSRAPGSRPQASATSVVPVRYLAKVELYINSKLPTALPPLTLNTSTWPSSASPPNAPSASTAPPQPSNAANL